MGGHRHRSGYGWGVLRGWTPTTLAVSLGSEFSLSLSFLLCKIGMTAETNLNGPSARPRRHPAGALTGSARRSAGLGAQGHGLLAGRVRGMEGKAEPQTCNSQIHSATGAQSNATGSSARPPRFLLASSARGRGSCKHKPAVNNADCSTHEPFVRLLTLPLGPSSIPWGQRWVGTCASRGAGPLPPIKPYVRRP